MCVNCKSQIVNFYNFKQKVKRNLYKSDDQNKTEVIEKVKEFLDKADENMIVLNNKTSLSIVPESTFEIVDELEKVNATNHEWPSGDICVTESDCDKDELVTQEKQPSIETSETKASGYVSTEISAETALVVALVQEKYSSKNLKRKRF